MNFLSTWLTDFFSTSGAIETVSLIDMVKATFLAFFLSLVVGYVYRITHQGASYSQATVHTMVIMAVVVSLIMMIIGSNIARAFSLVGALSIIRFRNAVKESRDVAFYFLAMGVGMACGTGFGNHAIVFTLCMSAMIYAMTRFDVGAKPMAEVLMKIQVANEVDYRKAFDEVFYKTMQNADLLSVDSDGSGTLELVYSVTLRKGQSEPGILSDVGGVHPSVRAQLIHGNTINL